MINSKLIKSLKKLSEKELESFKSFVSSPYFNKNKDLVVFFDLIISEGLFEYPKETGLVVQTGHALSRHDLSLRIGQSFKGRRLPDLMYGLTNLLEDFLAEEKYRQNVFQRKINLMSGVYEKDIDAMVNGVEQDLEMLHNRNTVRDADYLYESFLVYAERDYSFRLLGKKSDDESLQGKSDQLDLFYLALKLKDTCEMLNRSRIVATQYRPKMMGLIVPYLEEHPELYGNNPAVQIYLYMYLMLTHQDHEKYFFMLKQLADTNVQTFKEDELRSIYGYVQNYCIRRINQGNSDFLNHLFGIYRYILDTGLFFGENKNMEWDFKNFVSISLRLKEYDFTLQMINTFKEQLPANVRQNAYTYNLANYYYETAEYKKATRLLNSVEFTDIYYNLDSKTMLLKIYYKVEEEESFYALVSSFGIYLRRNRLISKENAELYKNLIRFAKKAFMLKTKLPYEKKNNYLRNVDLLKIGLEQTHNTANLNWLKSEVAAL